MITPSEIAFDVDSVFNNAEEVFLELFKERGYFRKKEQITSYKMSKCLDIPVKIVDEVLEEYWAGLHNDKLKPLPDSVRILTKIGKVTPVLFITAHRGYDHINSWIRKQLPELPYPQIRVVQAPAVLFKPEIVKSYNKFFFVDDHPSTYKAFTPHGLIGITYNQPWNVRTPEFNFKYPYLWRVHSWKELESWLTF